MKSESLPVSNDFPPVFDENAEILILGSLPSVASRQAGFYYMNPHNRFWGVLERIFGEPFSLLSREDKILALKKHRIALYDVILNCSIRSSSDASVKDAECTDIRGILEKSSIKKILLNGQKAHSLFLRFYPDLAPIAYRLPSTSPANAKVSFEELTRVWREALLPL